VRLRFRHFAVPTGALGIGALAAFLGACCGVPWLVAMIGVSAAIALARIAFLAPYLWLLAFGVAIVAVVWTYRVEPACDAVCVPARRRNRRIAAWLVLLALIGLFVAVRGWQLLVF
jgi:hypothetical protein